MIIQNNKKTEKKETSWLKDKNHPVLKELEEKGGSIFMNQKGEISYKLSPNDLYITTKDYRALSNIVTNFLGIDVDFSYFNKKIKNIEEVDKNSLVKPEDLIMVTKELFNPLSNEEFIKSDNGTYLLNKYKPSYYMQLDRNKFDSTNSDMEKTVIFYFILHLVNHDRYRAYWIINWIAYFFQGLKKSQVALVLIGTQGTGKNIFFNQIIRPLFGEAKAINDKSLNTKYKAALVEDVLFLNLDEISANTSLSDSQKNFIKALVTNESVTLEKKFKNLEKETPIYAQVLITSNEAYTVEIETNDRRFTVLSTGYTLVNTNFLGLGSYEALSDVLKSELEIFACYLKKYPVNVEMANTALRTLEKDEMIRQHQMKQEVRNVKQQNILQPKQTKLQKNIIEFATAISLRNIDFFNSIIDVNESKLKSEIAFDLLRGIFRIENLLPAFKILYGGRSFKTNTEFLRELQQVNGVLFSIYNFRSYKIDEEIKEFIALPAWG